MKKVQLVENIVHDIDGVSKHNIKQSVDIIMTEITSHISSGEGVEIRGFGSFVRKDMPARVGINPRTSEKTEVDAKKMSFFKPGKELKTLVNNI